MLFFVDANTFTTRDTGKTESTCHHCRVTGCATPSRQDTLGDQHAMDIIGTGLWPYQDDSTRKHPGAVPAYDVFLRELWAGILVQFMVCDVATGEPVGFVVAHSADLKSGFAHVAVLMSPPAMGRGWGVEAGALFITYLFATWSFRKLYAEEPVATGGVPKL